MLKRLFQRRRARNIFTTTSRLANPECLETRAMLTAVAIGDPLLVSESFSGTQREEVTSIQALVSGEQSSTIVFHGQGVSGARLPGNDKEIFFQQFENNVANGSTSSVNQITRGEQFHPKADVADDGTFWVVWDGRGEGDRQGVFARRFASDGTAMTDQVRVNTTRGGDQSRADIGVAADGSAVVVWHGVGDGDFDGVFAQRLSAAGELVGSESLVNQTTDDVQAFPVIAVDQDGSFVVSWSSRHQDGDDWGVFARLFDANGVATDDELQVAVQTPGSQHLPEIDMADSGDFVITWSSFGQDSDGWGVYARQFTAAGVPSGETQISVDDGGNQRNSNVAVSNAGEFMIAWVQTRDAGGWEVVAQTFNTAGATDGDQFTVTEEVNRPELDVLATPSVALNGFGNSLIAFQGNGTGDHAGVFAQPYEVDVAPPSNLEPVIESVDDFTARVGELVQVNIVASDPNGDDITFRLEVNGTTNELKGAVLTDNEDGTATLTWTPQAEDRDTPTPFRVIVTDNGDPPAGNATQFQIEVRNALPVVTPNVSGSLVLTRDNDSIAVTNSDFEISDADDEQLESARIEIRAITDSDERLTVETTGTSITSSFDAARNVLTLTGTDTVATYQKILQTLTYANTSATRTGGVRNIDISVSDRFGASEEVSIPVQVNGANQVPAISIGDQDLLSGSPLNIGIDGIDADGDTLTYTVTSSNPALVNAEIRSGNRSWKLDVSSPENGINGTMIFEFFEDQAPRATERFITLTNDDFYDGLTFHRIVNNFVIQGGDPNGNGTGGSTLDDFDDQFHVDLQHNSTGLLSMAKTADDTNNSQFFVTEGASRSLDGNHTIFGILTEGESVRDAISNVPAPGTIPQNQVTITDAEVFIDTENATLVLSSPTGTTGTADITVSVFDGTATTTETFTVQVTPDSDLNSESTNTRPWLEDIPTIETAVDTTSTYQLEGTDVEGDKIIYYGPSEIALETSSNDFPFLEPPTGLEVSVDADTGLMTITPSNGITGTFRVTVGVSDIAPGEANPHGFQITHVNDFQTIQIRIG